MADDSVAESIRDIQCQRLSTYQNNDKRITQDAKYEESDRAEYTDRFIYELLQNAVDEMEGRSQRRVRFELSDGELLTANTGRPFDISDLEALSLITDTTNGGDDDSEGTIGHKGRGFTSVLSITNNPQVHSSTGLDAECDSQRTARFLRNKLSDDGKSWQGRVPTMAVPFETTRPSSVDNLINSGHETVFRLPLRDGIESEQIETALREKLQPETLACLPEIKQVVVETDRENWKYEINRKMWNGTADARIVTVQQSNKTDSSPTTNEQNYVFFDRTELEPPEELVGISDRLLADIGQLSASIGFPIEQTADGLGLAPMMDEYGRLRQPPIHVFLPTEDRSPIPALLNGLFHVSNARRRLSIPEIARENDSESVNTFLFKELAILIGTEVKTFVDETDTSIATLLRCLDITISEQSDEDDGVGRALREEFVDRLRNELGQIEIIPRLEKTATGEVLDDRNWIPPAQVVVPHTNERGTGTGSEGSDLGPLVALLYGPDEVDHSAVDGSGWFPRQSLLTPELTNILEAMGATALEPKHTPQLLDQIPDSRGILQHTKNDNRLTVDPILHAVGLTWLGLTGTKEKKLFKSACRESRVIPAGSQRTADDGRNYYRHIAEQGDLDLFLPPTRSVPSERLNNVALFPYELYYLPENLSKSKRARRQYLEGSFGTLLESVLNHNAFGFNEVYNRAIAPSLPGPNSAVTDELIPDDDATIVSLLLDLSKGGTPAVYDEETPLPYEHRSTTRYFNLCLLPLPNKRGEDWAHAHEVYFGEEWQPDIPSEDRIEDLFDAASIDRVPLLAPPDVFGIDADDEDALEEAKDFFRWLGVTGHVRVTPFFNPRARHRYGATRQLDAVPGSVVDTTSDTTRWQGIATLEDEVWQEYRTTIEARLEERARGTESFYIWQINRLEYLNELTTAAKSDEEVARQLLSHINRWWERLERFADASLALWTNKTFSARQDCLYKDEELESILPNLWLWELRHASWLPTEHGIRPPNESWLLSDSDAATLFSLTAEDDTRSLLPLVTDKEVREVLAHRDGLTRRLGIRQALERSSFNPADARAVTEALASLFDNNKKDAIRDRTQELRSTYARLGETFPGLTQSGEIAEKGWHPSETGLGEVELLCRQGDTYRFVSATQAYFVRDSAAAERYRNLDVPLFILHRDEAARFGAYFDMNDLEASIETSTTLGETRREETKKLVDEFLEDVAPAILCRLQATRESEQMRQQDIRRLQGFLQDLRLVDSLTIEHTLRTNDENFVRHNRDVYVKRTEGMSPDSIYVATDVTDVTEDEPIEALARALSLHLEFPDWEPLYVLLQRGPEPDPLIKHLRTTGAPYRPEVLEGNRRVLTGDQDIDGEPELEIGTIERSDDWDEKEDLDTPDDECVPAARQPRQNGGSQTQTRDQNKSLVPDPEQLEKVGPREKFDPEIMDGSSGGGGGSYDSGSGSSSSIVTADYIDRVDKFGMAATIQAERDRIADECENPEEYIHDIHTSDLYREAKDHKIAGAALERLEEETRITEPYPGFDIIVVSRDEKAMPERCIELKSSSKNIQRPSITWNEWKSAEDSWLRQRYYLYVARELQTGKSSESTLLQIQNPFERLQSRKRTRRTEEREVQVRLDRVNTESDQIMKQPIYWEEETD